MKYWLNSTSSYHRNGMETLGWELTVSNALEPADSPCRSILAQDGTYGTLLFDFLFHGEAPGKMPRTVLEVGGGYGFVMRDLLRRLPHLRAAMLDISPRLLEQQKQTLRAWSVDYVLGDVLEAEDGWLAGFDMAILNENLGDLPSLVNVPRSAISGTGEQEDPVLRRAAILVRRYDLTVTHDPFNFNLGAIEAVEKLCSARIPLVFLCEHSCEGEVRGGFAALVGDPACGNPERIPLLGHDEYTIQFSFLEAVGRFFGYRVHRGPVADFLTPQLDGRLRYILTSGSQEPDHEIIRHFVHDLFKYEYLILTAPEQERGVETAVPGVV